MMAVSRCRVGKCAMSNTFAMLQGRVFTPSQGHPEARTASTSAWSGAAVGQRPRGPRSPPRPAGVHASALLQQRGRRTYPNGMTPAAPESALDADNARSTSAPSAWGSSRNGSGSLRHHASLAAESATEDGNTNPTSNSPVVLWSIAVLSRQLSLLQRMSKEDYCKMNTQFAASIGLHMRHNLGHYTAFVAALEKATKGEHTAEAQYDRRAREEEVEQDPSVALARLREVLRKISTLSDDVLQLPCAAEFMVSDTDGTSAAIPSTICRELAFVTHHAVHHNAIMGWIAAALQCPPDLPPDFGLATATSKHFKDNAAVSPSPAGGEGGGGPAAAGPSSKGKSGETAPFF